MVVALTRVLRAISLSKGSDVAFITGILQIFSEATGGECPESLSILISQTNDHCLTHLSPHPFGSLNAIDDLSWHFSPP